MKNNLYSIGIDVGGTFTDFFCFNHSNQQTFVYKIDSYNLNYENIETYKSDLKLMFSSYDALISKMNSINYN